MKIISSIAFSFSIACAQPNTLVDMNDLATAMEKLIREMEKVKTETNERFTKKEESIRKLEQAIFLIQQENEKFSKNRIADGAHVEDVLSPADSGFNKRVTHEAETFLNVRAGPDLRSEKIYALRPGELVNVVEQKNGMAFIGDGWCSFKYLTPITTKQKVEHP